MPFFIVFLIPFVMVSHLSAAACGVETDCVIDGGTYRIAMPDLPSGPIGAVVFFHGWQSTAAGQFRNRALVDGILGEGFAFVAPQGLEKTWSYPSSPSQHRDEFAFSDALRLDLIKTHGIEADRIVVSGFSMGGSMAWSLACDHGDRYAGFVPIAGAFWEPLPKTCKAPTDAMVHVHGSADGTVPMEGRPIGENWHQGDVEESFAVLLGSPDGIARPDHPDGDTRNLTCRTQGSGPGMAKLCMHAGGHSIRAEWVVDGVSRIAAERGWN